VAKPDENIEVDLMTDADLHREHVTQIMKENVYAHQMYAARNTFSALGPDCRTVIMAAEMQSGKSGVALALACLQRNSLSEEDITDQAKLRDTMYVLTMPDTSLLAQAKEDLRPCMNAVVSNLTHFDIDLERKFSGTKPKLIIIDECHYGSSDKAVRYEKLFDYIEKKNHDCSVVFISATPLSALLAAENGAILRRNLKTKLVFHKTSEDYHGIREMLIGRQVQGLNGRSRNLLTRSAQRDQFFSHIHSQDRPGWALVRVPSGSAMDAKKLMIKNGIEKENIFIIGSSLSGVPAHELIDIDQFKVAYEHGILFGKKMVAITVAGVRAGINFGPDMKESLIASWDSTVSSVAAIVQANIGRACGYHENINALHFTNWHGVKAYSDIVDYLEKNCSTHATDDLDGLRGEFERICGTHEIKGLDVGARVNKGKRSTKNNKIFDYRAFRTDSYLVLPGNLQIDFDYSKYTDDTVYLEAVEILRDVLRKSGPSVKAARSVPANSSVIASWVNGDTFQNKEKAIVGGPAFERVARFAVLLDQDENVRFNDVVPAGGGIDIGSKEISAYVFSIFNESKRNVEKKVMTREEVDEVASAFNVDSDDTIFVLFKRGEFSQQLTDIFIADEIEKSSRSRIVESNKFQKVYA